MDKTVKTRPSRVYLLVRGRNAMKERVHDKYPIDKKILKLVKELEELTLVVRSLQEIFFDKYLNSFKNYKPEGGK